MSDDTEPTEPEAAAPVDEQAASEAALLDRLTKAQAALVAATEVSEDSPGYTREAWWWQVADAHRDIAQVFDDATASGLWQGGSFAWQALRAAASHYQHRAAQAKHEAQQLADYAAARAGSGRAS